MPDKPNMVVFRAPENDKVRNFGYRKENTVIDTIVIHYTVCDFTKSYTILTMPRNVSAHYLIDRDGEIFSLVDEKHVAWHAGLSNWLNKESVNEFSIGIELVNSGSNQRVDSSGKLLWDEKDIFPEVQMTSLSQLIGYIKSENPQIEDRKIIGHSDITAWNGRKVDPGIAFNWKGLAKNGEGHGLYPKCDTSGLSNKILYKFGDSSEKITELQKNLNRYGYKINITGLFDDETQNVVRAFNMHFHTDTENYYECWDNISEARLNDLLTQI
jgi:N-acetylmuramoyl-L-alanine amidase